MAEVDYFISQRLHPGVLIALLDDVKNGDFSLVDVAPEDLTRIAGLVTQYADSDVGFVDAAVLALVERLNEPKLATLDTKHFAMMRPRHVDALTLLPE
jgi:predicted nucleic acid-binding protein